MPNTPEIEAKIEALDGTARKVDIPTVDGLPLVSPVVQDLLSKNDSPEDLGFEAVEMPMHVAFLVLNAIRRTRGESSTLPLTEVKDTIGTSYTVRIDDIKNVIRVTAESNISPAEGAKFSQRQKETELADAINLHRTVENALALELRAPAESQNLPTIEQLQGRSMFFQNKINALKADIERLKTIKAQRRIWEIPMAALVASVTITLDHGTR
jgi:hypothetical protein